MGTGRLSVGGGGGYEDVPSVVHPQQQQLAHDDSILFPDEEERNHEDALKPPARRHRTKYVSNGPTYAQIPPPPPSSNDSNDDHEYYDEVDEFDVEVRATATGKSTVKELMEAPSSPPLSPRNRSSFVRRVSNNNNKRKNTMQPISRDIYKCWGYSVLVLFLIAATLVGWKMHYLPHSIPKIPLHTVPDDSDDEDDDGGRGRSRHHTMGVHPYSKRPTSPPTKEENTVALEGASLVQASTLSSSSSSLHHAVRYDPTASLHSYNPFDFQHASFVLTPPRPPIDDTNDYHDDDGTLGFLMQPNMVNDTLVFVSEGDLYLSTIRNNNNNHDNVNNIQTLLPAMKLTTTVGNVRTPVQNPTFPYMIAYTATYAGRREVYLMDLRQPHGPVRLTYWDHPLGVVRVVGWNRAGTSVVFAAHSVEVGLPDVRLYQLALQQEGVSSSSGNSEEKNKTKKSAEEKEDKANEKTTKKEKDGTTKKTSDSSGTPEGDEKPEENKKNDPSKNDNDKPADDDGDDDDDDDRNVRRFMAASFSLPPQRLLQLQPVPLAQAIDGVYDDGDACIYFTRFSQTSHTIRYVGGTAESLWAFCHEQSRAVPLTADYRGTSKAPKIGVYHNDHYLLFLSDRFMGKESGWMAASMNLWAAKLPTEKELYNKNYAGLDSTSVIRLTDVSCEFDGLSLMEYTVDATTQNVVLRIGADLHLLSSDTIAAKLLDHHQNRKNLQETTITKAATPEKLPIVVYSDFHEHQERLLPVKIPDHLTSVDVYETAFGSTVTLLGLRGQLYVAPVVPDAGNSNPYAGAGMNLPPRRYRVAPGTTTGGVVRILLAKHVPLFMDENKMARRFALVLATDPKSDTAEHAYYLMETQSDSVPTYVDLEDLPDPFLGGSVNGGSVKEGGLGSVKADSVVVSPCGRRLAWTDTDGRICVMTLPLFHNDTQSSGLLASYTVLPDENEQGEPLNGIDAELEWSPGGRYVAITHNARNQFSIISIADCGDPERDGPDEVADIAIGRIVQATPDRFNSWDPYWGKAPLDFDVQADASILKLMDLPDPPKGSSTLYFLSDRDIISSVRSPWGTRAPAAHFPALASVFALPLVSEQDEESPLGATHGFFAGNGAGELWTENILAVNELLDGVDLEGDASEKAANDDPKETRKRRNLWALFTGRLRRQGRRRRMAKKEDDSSEAPSQAPSSEPPKVSPFPKDRVVRFGPSKGLEFARRAYRLGNIPPGGYKSIVCQAKDDPSLLLIEKGEESSLLKVFSIDDFPSDTVEPLTVEIPDHKLLAIVTSTAREHLAIIFAPDILIVVDNTAKGFLDLIGMEKLTKNIVDTLQLALSIWPSLEYQQLYDDAWRLLRDYFYDTGMNGVDWPTIHSRYRPLVKRCAKREELDDILAQMASELSALHVFVYGGEYSTPLESEGKLDKLHEIASLGATFDRSDEWKGYVVTSVPERDPDFNLLDGEPVYSPLSDRTLRLSGQRGLQVGDVIVGINGESVMRVPDIRMLLRGMAGQSVRLEVLRLASFLPPTNSSEGTVNSTRRAIESREIAVTPEPVITVPLSGEDASNLRYDAWEWRTRQLATDLASDAGFSVGYVHLRSMSGPNDIDAFARGFFPDYDKQALIVDVRHNRGGNIDSWLLDVLQRKAWMYWQGRATNITTGGFGWDEHFAFRGHLVVLIDEHTSSDGEGFSRGVSELGLGKLIGTRTWGGGIWLASDNHLVDGGIATAPEIGTYNNNFGWGLGIEQMGVEPDIEVDNDPRAFYDGEDEQLKRAIQVLKDWLEEEPIVTPNFPGPKRDMSMPAEAEQCQSA